MLKVQNLQGDEWGDGWEMSERWVRDVREMDERCEGYEWEISERCERDPRDFDKHGTTVQLWTDRVCFGLVSPRGQNNNWKKTKKVSTMKQSIQADRVVSVETANAVV